MLGDMLKSHKRIGVPILQPKDHHPDATCIEKLKHWIHGETVHKTVLFLVLLDLIVVVVGLIFEMQHLNSEVHDLEHWIEHECHHHSCHLPRNYFQQIYRQCNFLIC